MVAHLNVRVEVVTRGLVVEVVVQLLDTLGYYLGGGSAVLRVLIVLW